MKRLWCLGLLLGACGQPDTSNLAKTCPPWSGALCTRAAASVTPNGGVTELGAPFAAPANGALTLPALGPARGSNPGPLERAAAAHPENAAPAHPARARHGGGGRSSGDTVAENPPDATPEREEPKHGFANGVKCTFDSDCASDDCSFDVCKSKGDDKNLGNGVKCTFDSDCASGECSFDVCKSKGDSDQLGTGVKCTFDSDCATGRCSFDKCADDD